MMKLRTIPLLVVLTLSANAQQQCQDYWYDCLFCSKVVLVNWFNCCTTVAGGCCQSQCRAIDCRIGPMSCGVLEGDSLERNFQHYVVGLNCKSNGECGL
jgi:hypothetical protein